MAGGIPAIMNELSKINGINLDCKTVTGKTIRENIRNCEIENEEVIHTLKNPYSNQGGLAILKGNLALNGAVVKKSAVAEEMLVHEGPARVFNSEEEAVNAILVKK